MDRDAIIYLLIGALVISASYVVNKAGLNRGLDSLSFALTSGTVSAILAFIYILPKQKEIKGFSRSDWLNIIILGIIASGTAALTRFWGMSFTSAINANLLSKTNILFIVPIAYFMVGERISKRALLSILIVFVGSFLLSTGGAMIIPKAGDLIIIFAALQLAFANTLAKKVMLRISAANVSMLRLIIGAVFMLVTVPLFMGSSAFSSLSTGFWYVIVSGVLSVIYVFCLYKGIHLAGASIGNTFYQIQAIFTIILAYTFLGESLSLVGGLGGLLILIGSYLISSEHNR